ncbi:hypothetical protein FK498_17330 [Elioraea sp. Yellowstone]|jgi:hypothetical protein|uniref:hypothetical protein n=1 Tax=Elioraea sp. Yellowstone TaxID=2592070 RepID=UPI00114FF3B4|nr:hypothetical protein [Elioraea sp. Yellowstone]TQF76525.1 hypothetical protein FK498_17330 [Elioraea sp. Yellowstone]
MIDFAQPLQPNGLRQAPDGGPPLREDEAVPMPVEISFGDLLANLNPLHHIPVVGWVYRQVTGESVNPAFRALGGFLLGGPIGAIVAAVGALAESLFSDSPDAAAGGAVAAAPVPALAAGTSASAPAPAEAPLAERLGARSYPAPDEGVALAVRASGPAEPPDFAERMMRGLDAYERTLRLRRDQG